MQDESRTGLGSPLLLGTVRLDVEIVEHGEHEGALHHQDDVPHPLHVAVRKQQGRHVVDEHNRELGLKHAGMVELLTLFSVKT